MDAETPTLNPALPEHMRVRCWLLGGVDPATLPVGAQYDVVYAPYYFAAPGSFEAAWHKVRFEVVMSRPVRKGAGGALCRMYRVVQQRVLTEAEIAVWSPALDAGLPANATESL